MQEFLRHIKTHSISHYYEANAKNSRKASAPHRCQKQ